MLKIGEFSKLSLTTIKTLRYYEKEKLLSPIFIDKYTNYRYYDSTQLQEISKIKSLRQIGFSINEIKTILAGGNLNDNLLLKKKELEKEAFDISKQIQSINYLVEEKNMSYQVVKKVLPKCIVYYEERRIKDFSELTNLVLESGEECVKLNPQIECVKPDYCFVEYLDGEYREKDILVRYSQAVTKKGVENERIHFKELPETVALCIYHKGSYSKLGDAYSYILDYAKKNDYVMNGFMREVYIDGVWNKDSEDDYLTEIQFIIK